MAEKPFRASSRAFGRVAILLLLSVFAGCASWRIAEEDPRTALGDDPPEKVRITTADGTQTVLRRPRVLGEVLAGFEDGCVARFGTDTADCEETGVAIFEIETLEIQEQRHVGQVVVAGAALGVVWLLVNR